MHAVGVKISYWRPRSRETYVNHRLFYNSRVRGSIYGVRAYFPAWTTNVDSADGTFFVLLTGPDCAPEGMAMEYNNPGSGSIFFGQIDVAQPC